MDPFPTIAAAADRGEINRICNILKEVISRLEAVANATGGDYPDLMKAVAELSTLAMMLFPTEAERVEEARKQASQVVRRELGAGSDSLN